MEVAHRLHADADTQCAIFVEIKHVFVNNFYLIYLIL